MGVEKQVTHQPLVTAGSTLYYTTLYLRENIKHRVLLIHALHEEISAIPLACSDPGVARIKLEWWREETQRIEAGTARHPLGKQLQSLTPESGFGTDTLTDMITCAEDRITPFDITSYSEWYDFLDRGPGMPWRITARICGTHDSGTEKYTDNIIRNSVWLELLQEVYPLAQKGRCCFPYDKLKSYGLDSQAVITSPDSREVKSLLRNEYEEVARQLKSALEHLPKKDRSPQLALLILGRLSQALCREILKSPTPDPMSRIALTPLRRLWISWWARTIKH